MRWPGAPSLVLLVWMGLLLPLAALRGARRLRARRETSGAEAPPLDRTRVWAGTLLMLLLLGFLAVRVGQSFDYPFLAAPTLPLPTAASLGVLALALSLASSAAVRAWQTDDERRHALGLRLAPRTAREWGLVVLVVIAAGVCEEVAYRGVLVAILEWTLDAWLPAVLLSALVFALAHATQGPKPMVAVAAIGLLMSGLVHHTGSLLVAMVVHMVYDLLALARLSERAARLEA